MLSLTDEVLVNLQMLAGGPDLPERLQEMDKELRLLQQQVLHHSYDTVIPTPLGVVTSSPTAKGLLLPLQN